MPLLTVTLYTSENHSIWHSKGLRAELRNLCWHRFHLVKGLRCGEPWAGHQQHKPWRKCDFRWGEFSHRIHSSHIIHELSLFFLVLLLADYQVSIVRAKKLRSKIEATNKIHASQQSPIDAEWFIHPLRFYDAHVPRQLIHDSQLGNPCTPP